MSASCAFSGGSTHYVRQAQSHASTISRAGHWHKAEHWLNALAKVRRLDQHKKMYTSSRHHARSP
eukprot:6814427-Heterocapsa_arctica.AAC.1